MQTVFSIFPFLRTYNWVDVVILVTLLFYALEGYALGGVNATVDLLKFLLSFIVGLKFYIVVGNLVMHFFAIPQGISHALGFFISAFVAELIFQAIASKLLFRVKTSSLVGGPNFRRMNNYIGILPGLLSGAVLLMFLLTVIIALPVSPFLKNSIDKSVVGSLLIARSQALEQQVGNVFGGAANETLNFLTVEPDSNSSVKLNFSTKDGTVDQDAEAQMLKMVNFERTSRGLGALDWDSKLTDLARAHGQDMLARGYFSHYTPEGLSPFDRMTQADIVFQAAGENLAFSPNVQLAMQGLMQSPGHRANILSKDFGRVGIGVINAGIYGEMFVQEFTN